MYLGSAPQSGEAPIAENEDTQPSPKDTGDRRRTLYRRIAVWAGPVVLLIVALAIYFTGGRYVSEENAYVRAASVEIAPQVGGRVTQVAIADNEAVTTGDLLLKIDDEPYQIALNAAQADLAVTRNKLQGLVKTYKARSEDIAQAQASVDFAQKQFDRIQKLQKEGTATQAGLDAAHRDLLVAQSQLANVQDVAQSALAQLGGKSDVPADQQPEYLQAQSAVNKAKRDLRLTQVKAPFDGIVTKSDAVQVGEILAEGQPAFYLVSGTDHWIEANLKETELTHVRPGNSASIIVDAYPQQTLRATVESISPASGAVFALLPPQNASGNWVKVVQRVPVRLTLKEEPDHAQLINGMSVRVEIDTGHRRSLGTMFTDLLRLVGL